MRKYVVTALIIISLLTLAIWAINFYVRPILPSEVNSRFVLFIAILLSVVGVLAGFKDILELVKSFSKQPPKIEDKPQPHNLITENVISGPVQVFQGSKNNITINVSYIVQVDSSEVVATLTKNVVQAQPTPNRLVPRQAPPIPDSFTGRSYVIEVLKQALLQDSQTVGITSLAGMGGIGKTTLAIALAHDADIENSFPDGTLWASVGHGNFRDIFAQWILALDPPIDLTNFHNDESLLWSYFSGLIRERQLLIILDDVQRENFAYLETIKKSLGEKSKLLITTRFVNFPEVEKIFTLDVLPEQAAISLLEKELGRVLNSEERGVAREISFLVGYLPLALQLVAGYLKSGVSLTETRDRLQKQIEDTKTKDLDRIRERSEVVVQKTLNYTYSHLSPVEQNRFITLFTSKLTKGGFSIGIAADIWDVDLPETRQTLDEFCKRGLLVFDTNIYKAHPLLRNFASKKAAQQ